MKTFFKKRWNKHYHKDNKNRLWHITIDSLFSIVILTLIVFNTYLSSTNYGIVLGTQHDDPNNLDNNQNQNNNSTSTDTTTDDPTKEEPVIIPSTDIKLQSVAKYYTASGDQLGVGPLPPTASLTTKYWLFISLDEFTHNLDNVLVSAKLPKNVSLSGKSSVTLGENISFNENSREIKWSLNNLSTIDQEQTIGLAFEVELIPTDDQIGLIANLLTDIKMTALDSISKNIIIKTNPNITTNLISDIVANSNGIVIAK